MESERALRIGIDVGGTFTDLVAVESWTGALVVKKVTSTPSQPDRAVAGALSALLKRYDPPPTIEFVAHATTIATNALLGQLGLELPRVALVTTEGFADVIEIGRQNRSEVYNLFVERPRPLVERENRFTVHERIDYCGEVLVPLDETSIETVCNAIRSRSVAAVAICLLHSYVNDIHERRLAQALSARLPGVRVARSSAINPEYREYERCSTTVVNAMLSPIVEEYLERLISELRTMGVTTPLYVMRSDGGMMAAAAASMLPAALIESGPASGTIAAAALGRGLGINCLLSFDMGGTTAKAGGVLAGNAQVTTEFEAAGRTHSGRAVKGSGYPVRFPFIDLAEVSAGGGTIAWIDEAGTLRVGPLSAGADPGPACYGKSERPTVTDANVVLGRLNPHHLLGGDFHIDALRSHDAVGGLAARLGIAVEAAAAAIIALVDDAMARVLRIVTIERGLDPRDFALVAFGGGGPLHACALAADLGLTRIIVPAHPGLFSARGLLDASLRYNASHSVLQPAGEINVPRLETAFEQSEAAAYATLLEQGAHAESIAVLREYDARYRGQSFELTIPYDPAPAVVAARFHDAHRGRYGYDVPDEVIEVVNARLTVTAKPAGGGARAYNADRPLRHDQAAERHLQPEARNVWIDNRFVGVPVVRRESLTADARYTGPAIVESYDSTTYVAPEWSLFVDGDRLILEQRGAMR